MKKLLLLGDEALAQGALDAHDGEIGILFAQILLAAGHERTHIHHVGGGHYPKGTHAVRFLTVVNPGSDRLHMDGVHGDVLGIDIHLTAHDVRHVIEKYDVLSHILLGRVHHLAAGNVQEPEGRSQPGPDAGLGAHCPFVSAVRTANGEFPGSR